MIFVPNFKFKNFDGYLEFYFGLLKINLDYFIYVFFYYYLCSCRIQTKEIIVCKKLGWN